MGSMKIIPIRVGSLHNYYRSQLCGSCKSQEPEDIPLIIFYIEGGDKKILVDTGGGIPGSPSQTKYHGSYSRPPEEEPAAALKKAAGVSPDEIDIVVMTHLHWDHCCNNHLFPQAEFYVQKSEIIEAIDPVPRFKNNYESFTLGTVPPWAQQATKWKIVNGDIDLIDGVRLMHIPGHSRGSQGVLVETGQGPYFIAGDAIPLYDNCRDGNYIYSSIYLDLEAYYQSFEKIARLGAVIIPGHDPDVFIHPCYPDL